MNTQWKLVPVEPTETMVINGFESEPDECFTDDEVWEQYQEMSGCQQAAFRAKLCWAAMLGSAPSVPTDGQIEVVAVINEEGEIFKETVVEHRPGIDMLPVGTELVDIAHVIRLTAERDALQLRLNAADQLIDELTPPVSPDPITWGAPKTVRQLIQQLQTLDQDLRPLSMLRVPGNVFEDGKERTRAVHLSISHERVDGQWLAPFKSEGEKVLAFWCRMEQPDRSPEDYAIEHAEYMAKSADDVLAKFQAYGLALLAVDEGGDDGEGELFEAIDSARQDLQESLVDLRGMVYEFRKRSNRCTPQ